KGGREARRGPAEPVRGGCVRPYDGLAPDCERSCIVASAARDPAQRVANQDSAAGIRDALADGEGLGATPLGLRPVAALQRHIAGLAQRPLQVVQVAALALGSLELRAELLEALDVAELQGGELET